jgi:hypothetical protein
MTSISQTALDVAVDPMGTEDDKLLKVVVYWDFLDAPQSDKTTRFYNILKRNCFSLVSTMTVEQR